MGLIRNECSLVGDLTNNSVCVDLLILFPPCSVRSSRGLGEGCRTFCHPGSFTGVLS